MFASSTSVEQLSATSSATTASYNVLSHLYCICLRTLRFLYPCSRHPMEHPYHYGYQYDYSHRDSDGGEFQVADLNIDSTFPP